MAVYYEVVYFVPNNCASTIYVNIGTYTLVLHSLAICIKWLHFSEYSTVYLFFFSSPVYQRKYLLITSSLSFMYCTYAYSVYQPRVMGLYYEYPIIL